VKLNDQIFSFSLNDELGIQYLSYMGNKAGELRKTISANIKKCREILSLTQEKLAEAAAISANMVNDIEGCRIWFSQRSFQSSVTKPS